MPRLADPAEWRALRDARLRSLAQAPDAFSASFPKSQSYSDADWEARFAASESRAWFVEDAPDGAIVAMVVGLLEPDNLSVARLGALFVDPTQRGAGTGRRLVEMVEAWARGRGADRVVLDVNPELPDPWRLYERCGYRPTGNRKPLRPGSTGVAVELTKSLS